MNEQTPRTSLPQHASHPRDWRQNAYVYPVISRRSGGLSIGINLNPDTACNFDCIYCQVDRTGIPRVRKVEPAVLREELASMLADATTGRLFEDPVFKDVPAEMRAVKDIAFSGDGEPTTCKQFLECMQITAELKEAAGLPDTKIVLITDACYLTKLEVESGLQIMDLHNGEIWAKLDAGTEEYYRLINRPNYPLTHVIDNIVAAARVRPVAIQSMFLRLGGRPPSDAELAAYIDRLQQIVRAGGRIKLVQVYTIARVPAEPSVTPLSDEEVDGIAARVRTQTGLTTETYYSPS